MDINWKQMWTALGVVFAIVAGTVSITLVVTSSQISGLERSLAQLERSQSQQAENLLAITSSQISALERSQAQQAENLLAITSNQISALERSQAQQTESILIQLRLLNDKMNNIETEHAELRTLYERVGELRSDVNHIRDDVSELQSDVTHIRRNQDTMRADLDKILTILESGE